jgi:hypothetical protein
MQPTQYTASGSGVVILDEVYVETGEFMETPGIEALQEKATVVTEYFGLDNFDVGDCCLDYFHGSCCEIPAFAAPPRTRGWRIGMTRGAESRYAR